MDENERIVCEFLREIAPSREWRYLCEVEHCLIGELCDELNKQLKTENAKLREEFDKMDVWHSKELTAVMAENAKLREMARGLHMAYVETLNACEGLNEGLILEYSGSIDADVAKSRAKFEVLRHRFDDALRELGVGVDE